MLVMEYKAVTNKTQKTAINEAIRTSQFVRNKVLRYWMDNRGVGKKELYRYNTHLRDEFKFVKDLNSHACQASVENIERAINRFFDNCKKGKPGKKGYPRFKKHTRSVEYKQSGWKLHPTKRRITFTDKKGIGELKLLGKWDIHTFDEKLIKRVRIVKRADGFYVQFCSSVNNSQVAPKTDTKVGIDGIYSTTGVYLIRALAEEATVLKNVGLHAPANALARHLVGVVAGKTPPQLLVGVGDAIIGSGLKQGVRIHGFLRGSRAIDGIAGGFGPGVAIAGVERAVGLYLICFAHPVAGCC